MQAFEGFKIKKTVHNKSRRKEMSKKAKKKNARRLQKERQMIFQDSTSSLNQKMKVEKILAEPLEIHKVFSDKKEQHDFLCEMMEEVELQEHLQ